MNNKKEKKRFGKSVAFFLLMITLFGVIYPSAAFASDVSEEPQDNQVEMYAEGDTHTYTAENYFDASGTSTNAHFDVRGIFVDENNQAYLILFLQKNSNLKEIVYMVVNGTKVDMPATDHWEHEITVNLPDGSNKTLQSEYGMLVIEAGSVTNLQEQFLIDIKTTAGGWDITGLSVTVDIDYSIRKTAGQENAKIGDKLTYDIEITNNSEIPLQGVDITDEVPSGLNIVSVNGSSDLNWKTPDQVLYLDRGITLNVSETRRYSIIAEVTDDASAGLLTNIAVIGGSVIPKTASADVMISVSHAVIIRKIVNGNLGDLSKAFAFGATVKDADGNILFLTDPEDHSYTVNADGTISFRLKNEEAVSVTGIPDGAVFTVTEEDADANGYVSIYEWSADDTNWTEGNSCTIDQDLIFQVTNEKNGVINTSVQLDSFPFVLILAVTAVCIAVFTVTRRHRSV